MDFYDVIRSRKSVRGYKSDPIPEDSLDRIGKAVNLAPSACNLQPWSFRVILNETIRKQIHSCYQKDWLLDAPAIVVAIGNDEAAWKRLEGTPATELDMGIAMEHLILAAEAEGLSTCWICAFSIKKLNKIVGIMDPWSIIAISPLGYASKESERVQRKPLADIFRVIE